MLSLDCNENEWDAQMLSDLQKQKKLTAHYIVTYCNIFKSTVSLFVHVESSQQVEEVCNIPYIYLLTLNTCTSIAWSTSPDKKWPRLTITPPHSKW